METSLRKKHILCLVLFIILCFGFMAPSIQVVHALPSVSTVVSNDDDLQNWASQQEKWLYTPYQWYYFYTNMTDWDIYYTRSPATSFIWSTPVRLVSHATRTLAQLAVAFNGTVIAIAWMEYTANDYWFMKAQINADYSLTWTSAVKVFDGATYDGQNINLHWGMNLWWMASGVDVGSAAYKLYCWRSTTGASWTQFEMRSGASPFQCRYSSISFASTSTKTFIMYVDYYLQYFYYRIWDGATIGSELAYDPLSNYVPANTVKDGYFCLSSDASSNLWLVWRDSANKIRYSKYTGSWSANAELDGTATCTSPVVAVDTVKTEVHFFWVRSNVIYNRVMWSNGTLTSATQPFSGYTTTPRDLITYHRGVFLGCSWIDGDHTIKLGIINSPNKPIAITFYKMSNGSFVVDGVSVSNASTFVYSNGTALTLKGCPDSTYRWMNYTFGATAYTTNLYSYTIVNNGSLICWFSPTPTPITYITSRFRFIPTNETINHIWTFTDLSVSSSSISSYLWSFGDAGSSALQNPTHNYTAIGSFNVTLTVTSSVGSNLHWQLLNVTSPSTGGIPPGYIPYDQARAIMFGSVILIAVIMVPASILLLRRR